MSHHGCPERLSNRSKGFQDDGPSQSTMEVLVETLTGTAFEMTVLPTDTIFAIKSKIFRVEGIPVSQQHLLYNLVELDDSSSLREHSISDGARLRLVLGMRGGPISTRRLPPPPSQEPWRDIERLLDTNRDDAEWGGSGCKVTVLVFRDGERVNMLRVKENHDGTYSPLDHNKYSSTSSSLTQVSERESSEGSGAGSLHDNAVTMGKMLELRRRMETLSVQRSPPARTDDRTDKVEIQKTRSEETLSVPSLLDDSSEGLKARAASYAPFADDDAFAPLYDGNYTRYDYDCSFTDRYTLLPPIGTRADSEQSVQEAGADSERLKLSDALAGSILVQGRRDAADDAAILEECLDSDECLRQDSKSLAPIQAEYGPLVCGSPRSWVCYGSGARGAHSHSASSLHRAAPPPRRAAPLCDALFSSSTSDLEKLKRNSRILPALSRHRPRSQLHLSESRLDAVVPRPRSPETAGAAAAPAAPEEAPPAAPAPPARRSRARCAWCRKRLSIATLHRCRCGAAYCAPHRYAEVHGCAYDYRAAVRPDAPPPHQPKLPRI
ncbi:hypothetical protein PYW07_004886 [Mythimna separata]|uniref:AN1-type zinc finger protein 4 n=1 Tax=Mythimna separata TaxID=271217 RepID=A0AAD8DPE4_MYTSE|nr:hypothetical protein PYW07_004886 [Mythimna separata]